MGERATLPNDISRCEGAHKDGPTCTQRDTYRRMLADPNAEPLARVRGDF